MSEQRLDLTQIPARAQALDLAGARVHHLPDWGGYDDPRKLQVIRNIAEQRGRDPRFAKLAFSIIKKAKVKPREYKQQAAALLKWVQDPKNVYYLNEPGERLQDPVYTVRNGFGDCDDQVLVLCTLFEAVRLPWRLVISGRNIKTNSKARHIEGGVYPKDCVWSHIYCAVGTPAFVPKEWYFCEATIEGVPLGWDVVDGDKRFIPEMDLPRPGRPRIAKSPRAKHKTWRRLPPDSRRSPAYAQAYGGVGSAVGASLAEAEDGTGKQTSVRKIGLAVLTGVAVSVGTQVTLDWLRGDGIWKDAGPALRFLRPKSKG